MKFLSAPVSRKEDLKVISSACKKYSWTGQVALWRRTYKEYYRLSGNPWMILPTTFSDGISKQQFDLYDNRKSGGPIKRIRDTKLLLSCPVCGSGTTGHVDHYLPRSVYPEFAIMRANLVPTCPHCNSCVKGDTVRGTNPERFIHPYFDTWADKPLWYVEFIPPLEAVHFSAKPSDKLSKVKREIAKFHLKNVLGDQFHRSMENKWATLPTLLNLNIKSSKKELDHTRKALKRELKKAVASTGNNSWDSAFFRGLLNDTPAIVHLHDLRLKK
jgi:hypothetical protein